MQFNIVGAVRLYLMALFWATLKKQHLPHMILYFCLYFCWTKDNSLKQKTCSGIPSYRQYMDMWILRYATIAQSCKVCEHIL